MRLLVIEDDKKIRDFVVLGLSQEGYAVETADNGVDGFSLAAGEDYAVLVVDVMIPRLSGLELVHDLRKQGIQTPVLFLSARNSVEDRVRGLQTGGDDYLTKPFSFTELVARVQALVRRANAVAEPTSLCLGDLNMDLLRRQVTRAGKDIDLQPREFSLLEYLLRNKERIVSKTVIMEQVWGYDFDPQTNVVEARISRLRDKVDRGFAAKLIHTVRGVGYVAREKP